MPPIFPLETTTDTKSPVTPFNRANSQLQHSIFQQGHHHELCIFNRDEQEPAFAMICTSGDDTLSVLPLLKCAIHSLTVLVSTAWSP